MDTKALRQKILDLAIRGKLVPQDPNDEPASVLLEKIRAEKQQMVRDGKLKAKDIKDDTVIILGDDNLHYEKFPDGSVKCIEEEIPFEIPEGWEWSRLGILCPYGECINVDSNNISNEDWVLDLEDIEKDTGKILSYITKSERTTKSTKHKFDKGQLLYSKLRPYLNKVVIAPRDGYCTSEIIPLTFWGGIVPQYMQAYMMSDTFLAYVNLIAYGLKMPRLGTNDGLKALIAIPPINEQKRISNRINKTLPYVELIRFEQDSLSKLIQQTKSKILDLAIRGKLVPQDPNDEPASVLLERIRAEKEELIRQGKIKRDKKESVIFRGEDNSYYEKIGSDVRCIDEELPFEVPENWAVASFSQMNYYQSEIIDPSKHPDEIFELYSVPNYDLQQPEVISGCKIGSTKQQLNEDDVLLCKINPRINRVWIAGHTTDYTILGSSEWIVFRNKQLDSNYIRLYFTSPFFRELLLSNVSGVGGSLMRAQPDSVKKYPVLIPPITEQINIVNTVSSMYYFLNLIEMSLN